HPPIRLVPGGTWPRRAFYHQWQAYVVERRRADYLAYRSTCPQRTQGALTTSMNVHVRPASTSVRSGGQGQRQCHPVAPRPAVRALEATVAERLGDLGFAVVEDARGEERAAGPQVRDQAVGEGDQQARDQVREHEVERSVAGRGAALADRDD